MSKSPSPNPPPVDEPLIADDEENLRADDDSSYGSLASSSTSLASSILRFRQENGRSYHAYKPERGYILPSDEQESDRLDMQHHVFYLTFDGALYTCPAGKEGKPMRRVLDAGTGTGIWAMDFGDEHPESHVIGVDLSPIQPGFVPPNVAFYVDDLEDEWTFTEPFDLIYGRMLAGALTDWPKFMQRCFENLAPGGWLELADITFPTLSDDGTLTDTSALSQWNKHVIEAGHILNHSIECAKHYKQQMIDAGFVNVQEKLYKWPINSWPKDAKYKEIGIWTEQNFCGGIYGLSVALFTRALGWTAEELQVFLVNVRKDLSNRQIHAYWPIWVVYGQKPE
ncbi:Phosphoethanolamine N-methyltransferase 1 [Madurella mycetomatis]|uniref:Phosphoethanolamine N-methyltransferase 1 n=1 Tax=Madurella mycetomatis TaxID=100816 RepID=A0A175W4D2_9PEZI|nr:Phosphoethanolamine N-methyltransferase 1 [Madurella mycetomatis]